MVGREPPVGWFASLSDEEERAQQCLWQPFLQAAGGCFPLPVRFATRQECEQFIDEWVAGRGALPLFRGW